MKKILFEVDRGNGMTELKARDIKDILLLVSVIAPIIFGFVFVFQLLDMGVFFLVYWMGAYGWLLLFIYANSRDRRTGRHKRSHKR